MKLNEVTQLEKDKKRACVPSRVRVWFCHGFHTKNRVQLLSEALLYFILLIQELKILSSIIVFFTAYFIFVDNIIFYYCSLCWIVQTRYLMCALIFQISEVLLRLWVTYQLHFSYVELLQKELALVLHRPEESLIFSLISLQ